MSRIAHRLAEHHRAAKGRRALERALAKAPTEASRHELLVIANR
ncbi:MAG TPA: hypothetical protein VFR07_17995 [Mycobacteriales bacterium]|jgi:hypothetical protein|nr:hypothetical protein [Mycobacteriales bacterium]